MALSPTANGRDPSRDSVTRPASETFNPFTVTMTRTLQVETNRDSRLRPSGSKIRLKGQWLQDVFAPGSRVEIVRVTGGLLLRRPESDLRTDEMHAAFARVGL